VATSWLGTNLFETICKRLASASTPLPGRPVNVLNRLSFEGVLAVVESISHRCRPKMLLSPRSDSDTSDASTAIRHRAQDSAVDRNEEDGDLEWLAAARERNAAVLQERKKRKKRLASAAELFNAHEKDWLKQVQQLGLLESAADAGAVAALIREVPLLDKRVLGEYLSKGPPDKYPFNALVLREYASTCDFGGLTFDASLKLFLAGFHLPGEAQCIDRLMEAFASQLHAQWSARAPKCAAADEPAGRIGSPFKNADAAFILAFSTIMLQTDLHNPAMASAKRMTVLDFVRNNRGINDGDDLPEAFLSDVYAAIKTRPILPPRTPHASSLGRAESFGEEDWVKVLKKRVNRAAFSTKSSASTFAAGANERDMFQSIADATLAAFGAIFAKSNDASLLNKALRGFERYAAVCVYFDLQRPFHALLDHLLQHRPVQALSGFEDEASEADARQVSAVRLGLKLAVQGADLCREAGWARVVDLLLDVGDSRMLPATWTRIDDICSEDGRTLAPSSFAHRCKAHWTRAAVSNTAPPRLDEIAHKGALWSSLAALWRADDAFDGFKGGGPASAAVKPERRTRVEALLDSAECGDLFSQKSRCFSLTAVTSLLGTLLQRADPAAKSANVPDEAAEARAALALEFAWSVVRANLADRAHALWPMLQAQLQRVLCSKSTSSQKPYLAERCCGVALRGSAALLALERGRAMALPTIAVLLQVDADIISHIADRMALGACGLLRGTLAALLQEEASGPLARQLEVVVQLAEAASLHAKGRPHVRCALLRIVSHTAPDKFGIVWDHVKSLVASSLEAAPPAASHDALVSDLCAAHQLVTALIAQWQAADSNFKKALAGDVLRTWRLFQARADHSLNLLVGQNASAPNPRRKPRAGNPAPNHLASRLGPTTF